MLVLGMAIAVAVAGCGSAGEPESNALTSTATGAAATSTTPPDDPARSGSPTEPAPTTSTPADPDVPATVVSPGPRVVVAGIVEEGVEAGCLILEDYQLIADSALWYSALTAGDPVEVTGYVDRGRRSTCQQAKPLVITDVRPVLG
jgi:hypothetical protein